MLTPPFPPTLPQTYQMPEVPSIFTQLSMGNDSNNPDVYGPQTHAYVLEKGEVVDLQVINWGR